MNLFRSRIVMTLCLLLVYLCGYWTGLGFYLGVNTLNQDPSNMVSLLNQRNVMDIGVRDLHINRSNIYTKHLATPFVASEEKHSDQIQPDQISFVLDKSSKEANETFYNKDFATHSSNNTFEIALNRTFYITPFNIWRHRLGNQMFSYASLLGLARAHGRQLFIPPGTQIQSIFKLHHVGGRKGSNGWKVVKEDNPHSFDTNLMSLPLEDLRIDGWFQSFKYFKDAVDEVRQEFTFQDSIANEASMILHNIYANYTGNLVIGVHVRRGDFLKTNLKKKGYGVPQKSYFIKAFNWMKSKFPGRNITFLVASDDLDWCTANLIGDGVVAMPPASSGVHLAVLTKCDHVIISGGTFGYWGAWMAHGHVIYYTGYMTNDTILGKMFTSTDYYPPLWIGLGN